MLLFSVPVAMHESIILIAEYKDKTSLSLRLVIADQTKHTWYGMAHLYFFPLLLRERLTCWYIFDSPDQPLVDLIIRGARSDHFHY